jgi:hypothetical protein
MHDYALHILGWDRVSAAAAFSEALRASECFRLQGRSQRKPPDRWKNELITEKLSVASIKL